MASRLLCCADIGGTNARLQLWDVAGSGSETLRCDQRYATASFASLEPLLRQFLSDAGFAVPVGEACSASSTSEYAGPIVDTCSVAICMPVEGERRICGPGGVSWALDVVPDVEEALGKVIRRCALLNDFVAVGLGLHALEPSQIELLTPGVPVVPRATALCLGPGTGLGTCFLTWNDAVGGYDAHPGEGGAPEFAARTDAEFAFKQFLESPTAGGTGTGPAGGGDGELVIVENMVSGPGLGAHCLDRTLTSDCRTRCCGDYS
jgi:glucokinase